MSKEQLGTPDANWRREGKVDPFEDRYNTERSLLAMGNLTDDELANAVFMHFRDVDGIAYVQSAQERIRWLSRQNANLMVVNENQRIAIETLGTSKEDASD